MEAARRVELLFQTSAMVSKVNKECSLEEWKVLPPNAFLSSTASQSTSQTHRKTCYNCGYGSHIAKFPPKHKKEKQPEMCRNYSRFAESNCERDNNKCPFGRQHKCQRCNKWGCKAVRHSDNGQSSSSRTSPPPEDLNSLKQHLVVLSTHLDKFVAQSTEKPASASAGKAPIASSSRETASAPSEPSTASTRLFGLPAVTIPTQSSRPEAQLHHRNILWISIVSAGQRMPLPLYSCRSVSLVSKEHADRVASKQVHLKYQALFRSTYFCYSC